MRGRISQGRTSQGANEPGGEGARGQKSQGANRLGGEMAKGRISHNSHKLHQKQPTAITLVSHSQLLAVALTNANTTGFKAL